MSLLLLADGTSFLTLASSGGRLQLSAAVGIPQGVEIEGFGSLRLILNELGSLRLSKIEIGMVRIILNKLGTQKLTKNEIGIIKTILNELGKVE